MRLLSYSKQWRKQLLSALTAWTIDQHQETNMAAMGIFLRVAFVQTPVVEPLFVNMAATLASECRKQTM